MPKVTIKSYRHFQGMDGECFTANILFDGKVVGDVNNDGNGGSNFYSMSNKDLAILKEVAAKELEDSGPEIEDVFIENLISELEIEKLHKKNVKAGFPYTVWLRKEYEEITVGVKSKLQIPDVLEKRKGCQLIKVFG